MLEHLLKHVGGRKVEPVTFGEETYHVKRLTAAERDNWELAYAPLSRRHLVRRALLVCSLCDEQGKDLFDLTGKTLEDRVEKVVQSCAQIEQLDGVLSNSLLSKASELNLDFATKKEVDELEKN